MMNTRTEIAGADSNGNAESCGSAAEKNFISLAAEKSSILINDGDDNAVADDENLINWKNENSLGLANNNTTGTFSSEGGQFCGTAEEKELDEDHVLGLSDRDREPGTDDTHVEYDGEAGASSSQLDEHTDASTVSTCPDDLLLELDEDFEENATSLPQEVSDNVQDAESTPMPCAEEELCSITTSLSDGLCSLKRAADAEECGSVAPKRHCERSATVRDIRKMAEDAGTRFRTTCCGCRDEIEKQKKIVEFWRKTAKGLQDIAINLARNLNSNHVRKQRTVATNTPVVRLPITAIPGGARQVIGRPQTPPVSKQRPGKSMQLQPGSAAPSPLLQTSAGLPIRPQAPVPGVVRKFRVQSPLANGTPSVSKTAAPLPLLRAPTPRNNLTPNRLQDDVVDLTSDEDERRPSDTSDRRPLIPPPLPNTDQSVHLPPVPRPVGINGMNSVPGLLLEVKGVERITTMERTPGAKVTMSWEWASGAVNESAIRCYELFAFHRNPSASFQWQLIKSLDALDLPMACIVTLRRDGDQGNRFWFTVRAVGSNGSKGACSRLCSVEL